MGNVVSFSLFGDAEQYCKYLPAAIRAHHNLYQGWSFRIHHDSKLDSYSYGPVLRALHMCGLVELHCVSHKPPPIEKGMLWRLLPLWDINVDRFITRDIDTLPGFRERCAVEGWVKSGLAAHAISDNALQHNYPTMGGMMGFTAAAYDLIGARTFNALLERAGWPDEVWNAHHRDPSVDPSTRVSMESTNDQYFLKSYVWPLVRANTMEHRLSGSCTFPGVARSQSFIGSALCLVAGVSPSVAQYADRFVPFIGSVDVDYEGALAFYREYGDLEIERLITECESWAK